MQVGPGTMLHRHEQGVVSGHLRCRRRQMSRRFPAALCAVLRGGGLRRAALWVTKLGRGLLCWFPLLALLALSRVHRPGADKIWCTATSVCKDKCIRRVSALTHSSWHCYLGYDDLCTQAPLRLAQPMMSQLKFVCS